MALISVTRLRLRSLWFLPAFARHTWASTRQVQRATGFQDGQLAVEGIRGFWTVTAWSDEAAMRQYRNTDAHMRAMPKLLHWCDEASVVHWQQDSAALPSIVEALERMVAEGRLSKVRHPSPEHAAKQIAPERTLRPGPRLQPVTRA